ncbi:2-hydroxyglutaryl-CoA dehydratase [Anaerocolumna cellulosilytica]|uniref:2-hydroxyglutaryl-CoA dehydratase n=1 Tax=Anaerocolumna cellulosilytica TaxID=433286 RepID=A0A6S6R5V0_9FIRM|nr:2-hydroxyacyl-CoA dehydratase family protein [Anaerocolumna cellulosilytica]MBB5196457.1 benzoyl-CoA reductase/2-hydroxyglutaryl-CoA dehydratase subunit BcrC/BadD/HgdB [Anaerocolumna cellulosilytica]BCJ94421.1 2-hydroxyglutaryl-CoA dehydratase [Anaerocolumna cellulosilytica]
MNQLQKKSNSNMADLSRSTRMLNNLLLQHYNGMHKLKEKKQPVAWVGVDIPAYLFRAMGIVPVYPQIHAAFQAQRNSVKTMIDNLESRWEIPHNICGEVKGVIGAVLCENGTAFDIPKPDILITSNSTCGQISKGFSFISKHMGVDLIDLDFPFIYNQANEDMLQYASIQIDEMFGILENKIGHKLDVNNLLESYANIQTFSEMWGEICEANIVTPAPVNALDLYMYTSCFLTMDTEDKLLSMLAALYNEVFSQVERNKQIENEEKYRILWHYLPIYSKKRFFKQLFDEHKVSLVTGTYLAMHDELNSPVNFDFHYPVTKEQIENAKLWLKYTKQNETYEQVRKEMIEYTAESMLMSDVHRGGQHKFNQIKKMVEKYRIDGVILHNDRSCRPQSLPQYDIRSRILEELKVPVLLFDSDTMDERYFSESQITTRFEAFIERMALNKGF